MEAQRVRRERLLRVLPCEQLDRPLRRRDELAGYLAREAGLICVANRAATNSRNGRDEGDGDEQETDRAARDRHPGSVAAAAAPASSRRRSEQPPAPSPVR